MCKKNQTSEDSGYCEGCTKKRQIGYSKCQEKVCEECGSKNIVIRVNQTKFKDWVLKYLQF